MLIKEKNKYLKFLIKTFMDNNFRIMTLKELNKILKNQIDNGKFKTNAVNYKNSLREAIYSHSLSSIARSNYETKRHIFISDELGTGVWAVSDEYIIANGLMRNELIPMYKNYLEYQMLILNHSSIK